MKLKDADARLRRAYTAYVTETRAKFDRWIAGGLKHEETPRTSFPDELRGLTCGAKTRAGTPCKRRDIYDNTRCKLHGGMSTGPKTKEGKRAAQANLKRRWNPMSS